MEIFNTKVYGIEETLIRSGYPMATEIEYMEFLNFSMSEEESKEFMRVARLGASPQGSGHDCALKGIIVQCDIEAPSYWWPQFQRYHFADIISSQSKMHRITALAGNGCPPNVYPSVWATFGKLVRKYELQEVEFETLLANCPQGLELVAGITTNYLQIKTMYAQRANHRLTMWNTVFVDWVKSLPYAKEFGIIGGNENE